MKNFLLGLVLLCPFLAFTSTPARADSVTYTFTGTGNFSGTVVTYVNQNGFLSFDDYLAPTTTTDYIYKGNDYGLISGFDFYNSHAIFLSAANLNQDSSFLTQTYNLNTFGTQDLGVGTLTIEASAVTPEPSSVLLLATGALGLIAPLRRRFVRA